MRFRIVGTCAECGMPVYDGEEWKNAMKRMPTCVKDIQEAYSIPRDPMLIELVCEECSNTEGVLGFGIWSCIMFCIRRSRLNEQVDD